MKVFILGRGFLGTKIYNHLKGTYDCSILSKADLDYTNPAVLGAYLYHNKHDHYNIVLNASGYTGKPNIDAAEDDKETCWKYNVEVPVKIAQACKSSFIDMIHLSSGCIYNGYDKVFTEGDTPNFGMFSDDSSFYSKTKHAAELMLSNQCWLFRLRMPFTGDNTPRNYFNKLLGYDNLISQDNSVTSVEDLAEFCLQFISLLKPSEMIAGQPDKPAYGPYNVVNEGTLNAREIVEIMKEVGLENPNHQFISLEELDTKAKRSNCVLSSDKIKLLGLALPDATKSARKALIRLKENIR